MFSNRIKSLAIGVVAAMAFSTAALAGPTYTFSTSEGVQPADVGMITLTQLTANSVQVLVDLKTVTYGFMNSGGPHTPFAFNLTGSGTLSIDFTTPDDGIYSKGAFSLNTAGGGATPFGVYGIAIDDSAGNGSVNAYYGDLLFTLTRTGGLSTDDFVANSLGYYFAADLTDGRSTGSQAWKLRDPSTPPTNVPEPLTLSLVGAGLIGTAALRRKSKKA
jgi:hypothetical protein